MEELGENVNPMDSHHYSQRQSNPEVKRGYSTSKIESLRKKEVPNVPARVAPRVQRRPLKFPGRRESASCTCHSLHTCHATSSQSLCAPFDPDHQFSIYIFIQVTNLSPKITYCITILLLNPSLKSYLLINNINTLVILLQARGHLFH